MHCTNTTSHGPPKPLHIPSGVNILFHRTVILTLLIWLGPTTTETVFAQQPSMYVYLNLAKKPRVLQRYIRKDLKNIDIIVFGRVADFNRQLSRNPPDAILTLRPILQDNGYTIDFQGYQSNQDSQHYLIVSEDGNIVTEGLQEKKIGIVDLFGKSTTSTFLTSLFGIGKPKRLNRVSKSEDLLRLLQYGMVDAVVLPEDVLNTFLAWTNLDLKTEKIQGAMVGLAAISLLSKQLDQDFEAILNSQPQSLYSTLNIDEWRREQK